ncbi:ABC transporter permease subunit [Brevibacillus laterosporus]|uniref:ABC transporter permease subunit n=1 Tax=Brevibacillus laterosporus TaxID=1465 RepID=UPI00264BF8D9|nr:ABC transporter permease subunit [Brevibacillus laterosporus]MDN9008694.1 ABC transporter permease subunit [Brevibacillus laterosporus]MDO0939780.1 ABC transporter permease subunit [Brevibacillus laterosporus]
MFELFKFLKQIITMLILVVILAGLPQMLAINEDGLLFITPENVILQTGALIHDVSQGTLGQYISGFNTRSISEDILPFAKQSFILLLSSLLVAIIVSILFGLFLHRWRVITWIKKMLDFISIIPDFILILFCLFLTVTIYKTTGVRLLTISPLSNDLSRIWFPILILSIGPMLYLVKLVDLTYKQVGGEDYIRTAVAKGFGGFHVQLHHMYKNIKPFFIADLKKAISISVTNLFIVEYLLNVSGITRFIFGAYQFNIVVIGLCTLLLITGLVYAMIRLLLYLFERGFIYE